MIPTTCSLRASLISSSIPFGARTKLGTLFLAESILSMMQEIRSGEFARAIVLHHSNRQVAIHTD